MNTLTKDQVQQLTPEQQSAVATMELRRVQKHERLLKQARQSRYSIFGCAGLLAIAYGLALYFRAPFWMQMSIFSLAMAIFFQSVDINRRLDAMLELFEDDHDA